MTEEQKINACIAYLQEHGYVVHKRSGAQTNLGRWVAFRQVGMSDVRHGRVVSESCNGFVVRCKNGVHRRVCVGEMLGIFDTKAECYAVR